MEGSFFRGPLIRVPCYIGDLKRDPNGLQGRQNKQCVA